VYDSEKIANQYNKLVSAFKVPKLEIHYACKALSNLSILRYVKSLGAGLDAVSINEVKLGLLAGFAPEDIIFTPNCVSIEEIEEGMRLGVKLNIDDLEALEYMGMYHPDEAICIRIN